LGGKLKKAAVIGVGAYVGYKLTKATAKFALGGASLGYRFNDWDDWREADGFLCRRSTDCNWLHPQLYCQDYELDFSPSRAWFGGDFAAIVGECACSGNFLWDDDQLECRQPASLGIGALIAIIIVACGVIGCCCVGFCCYCMKRNS